MAQKKESGVNKYLKFTVVTSICILLLLCIICGCSKNDSDWKGTKNQTPITNTEEQLKPVFSDRGGFYQGEFDLKLSIPDSLKSSAECIKITFDGSEPTNKSATYKDSISIPGNNIKTDFDKTSMNVKVSVVRAACFDKSGNIVGQIATATYIQLRESKAGSGQSRFDMPVISLVTEQDNLDNKKYGIFKNSSQKGSEWERPVHVSFFESDGTLAFAQDAGIRLFGGSTRNLAQKSFRITARKTEYFNTTIYDGAGKFKYELFPERLDSFGEILTKYDSFILRNGGNDSVFFTEDTSRITFLRDGLAAKITKKAAPEIDIMDYRPVVVFLNGEYYGIMNMREHQNNKYIQNVYGIEDKEGITVITTEMDTNYGERYDGTWFYYEQSDGPDGELEVFTTLLDDIVAGKYTYEQVCQKIDMDNFMKYCAINLFLCNTDWPHNNVKVWRYAGNDPGEGANISITDGKWRFMFKDADLGMGRFVCAAEKRGFPIELYTKADCKSIRFMLSNYITFDNQYGYPSIERHTYPDTLKIQGLFYFCLQNEAFFKSFYDFCYKLTTEICTPDVLESIIKKSADSIRKELANYLFKGFGNWQWEANTTIEKWEKATIGETDSLITWANERSGANGEFMKQIKELKDIINK